MTDGREPDTGAALLNDVEAFIGRFCAFKLPAEHVAVTLWAVHTHTAIHLHTTPRLALLSPEPGSGKTRVLEVLALLVANPMFMFGASAAAIFRKLAIEMQTLLFDEVDATFSKRGKDDANEDVRALLNVGYKRGASIPRCVGPRHEVMDFPVFAPVAMAGLGDLPDTLMSRSVIIRMRKRSKSERIEPFRSRQHEPQGRVLQERIVAWAAVEAEGIGNAWPALPAGIVDRPAEVWEPLLAVADAAGGQWPRLARQACIELCKVVEDREVSLGVRLLADLRTAFGDADALPTADILEALNTMDEAPWGDLYGKPLAARWLARTLKRYDVSSVKVKVSGRSLQGYRREELWDAWQRYLTPPPAQPEPPEPGPEGAQERVTDSIRAVPLLNTPSGTARTSGTMLVTNEVPAVRRVPHTGNETEPGIRAQDAQSQKVPEVPATQEPERGTSIINHTVEATR